MENKKIPPSNLTGKEREALDLERIAMTQDLNRKLREMGVSTFLYKNKRSKPD